MKTTDFQNRLDRLRLHNNTSAGHGQALTEREVLTMKCNDKGIFYAVVNTESNTREWASDAVTSDALRFIAIKVGKRISTQGKEGKL